METATWMEVNGHLIHQGDEVLVRNVNGVRLRGTWTFQWKSHSSVTGNETATVFGGTRQQTRSFNLECIEPVRAKRGKPVRTSR